eukprot:2408253-Pyramimonas_sp.AAC.1
MHPGRRRHIANRKTAGQTGAPHEPTCKILTHARSELRPEQQIDNSVATRGAREEVEGEGQA